MSEHSGKPLSPGTILARGGRGERAGPGGEPRPLSEPLTLASVYRFNDLDQVNEVWDGRQPGHVYRRFGHPNSETLEGIVASLERAETAVACSSGMAALLVSLAAHLGAGDCVVAPRGLYGGTQTLLGSQLSRFGVVTSFAAGTARESFAQAVAAARGAGRRPKALLVETIANPSLDVADLPGLAGLAGEQGLLLVVDNTFATPLGCRPLQFGPALVVHSLTKYLGGHSDVIGGVVAGSAELIGPVRKLAIAIGATLSPMDAWLTVRGLKTLHLRFQRQQENAAAIADWLGRQAQVSRVLYPGLKSHPSHATAGRVLDGYGAMVSFELSGGEPAVERLVRLLRLISFAPSLGENETTIMYPAITSHRNLSPEEREAAGATPGLIRLSAGTEALADLLADLEQALAGQG